MTTKRRHKKATYDDMRELSTAEIAVLAHKSERQVQRWIKDKKLPAEHIKGNVYRVDEMVVADLVPGGITALDVERLDTVEDHIDALERRVQTLEARLDEMIQNATFPQKTPQRAAHAQKQASTSGKKGATSREALQPPDTITLESLATELGIERSTMVEHAKDPNKHFDHTAKEIPGRPGQFYRYFSPEQADYVRSWHEVHSKKQR